MQRIHVYCTVYHFSLATSTFRYIELKFKQINEYLQKMEGNNEYVIKQAWEHSTLLLCQKGCPKSTSNKYTTWVVMYYKNHINLINCSDNKKYIENLHRVFADIFTWNYVKYLAN